MSPLSWVTLCRKFATDNNCTLASLVVNEEDGANLALQVQASGDKHDGADAWRPTKSGCLLYGTKLVFTNRLPKGSTLVVLNTGSITNKTFRSTKDE